MTVSSNLSRFRAKFSLKTSIFCRGFVVMNFLRFKEQANCFDAEMKGNRKYKIVVMKQLSSNKHKQRNSRSYDFEVQSLESLKYAKSLPWALR